MVARLIFFISFVSCLVATLPVVAQVVNNLANETERVWKFDLITDPHVRQNADNSREPVPQKIFGQLLVSNDRQKFVYRYLKTEVAVDALDPNEDVSFSRVVGFDGNNYWYSTFSKNVDNTRFGVRYIGPVHTRRAAMVFRFKDKALLDEYQRRLGRELYSDHVLWYESAPIHQLFFEIGVAEWDYQAIETSLKGCALCRTVFENGNFLVDIKSHSTKLPFNIRPTEFYQPIEGTKYIAFVSAVEDKLGGNWNYLIEFQDTEPFLSKCRVVHKSPIWSGPWPFITPSHYTITLNPNQITVAPAVFNAEFYSSSSTTFEDIESKQPEYPDRRINKR